MSTRLTLSIAGAVATMAALIVTPLHAAQSAGAQLGPVGLGGGLKSGSTLSYQLNLTVTSPGTLTATASLKAKGLKQVFPELSAPVVIGTAALDSAPLGVTVQIPPTFTGEATFIVKTYLNGKKVGTANLLVTISAPSAAPALPQTTWYDVGYGTSVVVNANAVATNGLTGALTYAWKITDTDLRTNATLSGANTATPTLATQPITTFTNIISKANHTAPGIDIEKEFDLDTNPNLVGITTEQVDLSTYHLRVVVTDAAALAKTGTVTVIASSVSPAQPTIPLGERQYLTAMPNGTNASSYSWTVLVKPSGSTTVLESPTTRTPALRPDKEGDYTLRVTVTGGGQTNSSFTTVRGATFVGVATCASCHGASPQVGLDDYYGPWSQTAHASMAQRGVDGFIAPYYSESCLACHTVGNNKATLAVNGGFDDVQKQLGWKFPSPLQVGNYAAMPAALQNLANIQCESCHGPGSQHPGEQSTSLDVAVCATCHQDGSHHFRPGQWALGPHGNDDNYLVASEEEAANPSCAKCHSPTSFVDNLKGKALTRLEAGRLTCQACHDPHNEAGFPPEAHQVRIYDNVTLDDSVYPDNPPKLTGQGPSALCMFCHNARRGPPATYITAGSNGTRVPHESTATDVLFGLRASTNVQVIVNGATNTIATVALENSAHSGVAKCVTCHMYPGKNTVGDHTFSMTDRLTEEDHLEACQQCHAGVDDVEDFDHISVVIAGRPHGGDYDGNSTTEGVQTEVDGLVNNLTNKMAATGIKFNPDSGSIINTSYSTNALTRAVQRNAAWNYWLIERELSHGIHNTAFTVRLLQWSYTVLSTNTGGQSYQADFPNTDLR